MSAGPLGAITKAGALFSLGAVGALGIQLSAPEPEETRPAIAAAEQMAELPPLQRPRSRPDGLPGPSSDAILVSRAAMTPAMEPLVAPGDPVAPEAVPDRAALPRATDPVLPTATPAGTPIAAPSTTSAQSTLPACVQQLTMIAERARVTFGSGSASVDAAGREMALTMAAHASVCPEAEVTILGFADPSGSMEANVALSNRRAQNVLQLIAANGFATDRFAAQSHMAGHPDGEECPHFDVVDRRVEFVVRGDGEVGDTH